MNADQKCLKIHTVDLRNGIHTEYDSLFSEEVYTPNITAAQLHSHNFVHICQIMEGSGVHCVFDQAIPCKAGDIFITPPDTPHGFFLSDEGESPKVNQLLFHVEDWFDGEVATVGEPRYCYGVFMDNAIIAYAMLNEAVQKEVSHFFEGIKKEIVEKRKEWREVAHIYLTHLLITVGRYINNSIKNDPLVSSKDWSLVLSVMRMTKEQYADQHFTLKSVSELLFISQSHLSKVFKELTGQPFSEYLRDIRIENACRLLRETNMTVEEIVWSCGLRDVPSFYHNFCLRIHMTPRQYRQMAKLENNKKTKNKNGELIMSILTEISENLQKGKAKIVKELVQQAIDAGSNPEQILNEGLLAGMSIIGEKFKNNEVYVPEVLVAARAMNMGMQILKPYLLANGVKATGKVCIGTVQGDLHDIGKNLVKMMMEGKGLEVIDLGTDVSPEAFVQAAVEQGCQVICCSALLTTTMNVMEEVVKAAEAAGIRYKVKIMVGGAPVNQEFCAQIGADCYTVDAASAADAAVELCKSLT